MKIKWWLPIIPTVLWLVLMIGLLPKHGLELIEVWGENKKQEIGKIYANSQYVKGDAGQEITDSQLYLYSSLAYTQGQDPTTINFEHPPLGKYLWGVSWQIFGNPYFLNTAVIIVVLFTFYCLGQQLKISPWLLILGQGLLVFVIRPSGLIQALLDYQLLAWTLVFFLVTFWKKETWYKFALIGLALGGLVATKYPIPNIFPYLVILLWQLWTKKTWKLLPFTVAVAGAIYLLSYGFYFAAEHSLLDLLQFEKYRFDWWTGDRPLRWYLIWQVLFLGKFQAWWVEGWHNDDNWSILLPLVFVLSTVLGVVMSYRKLKKINQPSHTAKVLLLWFFSLIMMGLYTFGSAMAIRYLLIVVPCWYLMIAHFTQYLLCPKIPQK